LPPESRSRRPRVCAHPIVIGIILCDEYAEARAAGQEFVQETKLFWDNFAAHIGKAGHITAWPAEACHQPEFDRVSGCGEDNRNRGGQRLAASAATENPGATMTSTLRRTISAAASACRSRLSSPHRNSIARLRPSTKLVSLKPFRKAASKLAPPAGVPPRRNPTTGTPRCCARDASGHAAAAPLSSAMKSRRLIQSPRRRRRAASSARRGRVPWRSSG